MNFQVLATDYDGTLATHGAVDESTLSALARLRAANVRILLVTGREIDDLRSVFPHFDSLDLIIGENGGLLHWPSTGRERVLAESPPPEFAAALRKKSVRPLSVGRVVVATFEPHEGTVLETIKEMGLELYVALNKGAVMVLPTGVNKATGLTAALEEWRLLQETVVGVGDAENDHAFLDACGYSVAVQNALPTLKRQVDWVTKGAHGVGVEELIDRWLSGGIAGRGR